MIKYEISNITAAATDLVIPVLGSSFNYSLIGKTPTFITDLTAFFGNAGVTLTGDQYAVFEIVIRHRRTTYTYKLPDKLIVSEDLVRNNVSQTINFHHKLQKDDGISVVVTTSATWPGSIPCMVLLNDWVEPDDVGSIQYNRGSVPSM